MNTLAPSLQISFPCYPNISSNAAYKLKIYDLLKNTHGCVFYEIFKPYELAPFVYINENFENHEKLFLDMFHSSNFDSLADTKFMKNLWNELFPNTRMPIFINMDYDTERMPIRGSCLNVISKYYLIMNFIKTPDLNNQASIYDLLDSFGK